MHIQHRHIQRRYIQRRKMSIFQLQNFQLVAQQYQTSTYSYTFQMAIVFGQKSLRLQNKVPDDQLGSSGAYLQNKPKDTLQLTCIRI